jgi:hypothetical protein
MPFSAEQAKAQDCGDNTNSMLSKGILVEIELRREFDLRFDFQQLFVKTLERNCNKTWHVLHRVSAPAQKNQYDQTAAAYSTCNHRAFADGESASTQMSPNEGNFSAARTYVFRA